MRRTIEHTTQFPISTLEQIVQLTSGSDIYDVYLHTPTNIIVLECSPKTLSFINPAVTLREILLICRLPPNKLEIDFSIKDMSAEQILDIPVSNIGLTRAIISR
jgi:hypothetical protein